MLTTLPFNLRDEIRNILVKDFDYLCQKYPKSKEYYKNMANVRFEMIRKYYALNRVLEYCEDSNDALEEMVRIEKSLGGFSKIKKVIDAMATYRMGM